mmetsp:Transcript_12330/g.12128  ORF Transcript_12330/g.12128 Transcript_12330/m.12128 type:complete len:143 (+) Transcript_12330:1019-1447(+)
MKRVTELMKKKVLNCKDLAYIVYDLYVVKLQAPKLIEIIVKYFNDMNFNENDLIHVGDRIATNFIHQVSYLHGKLNDKKFFRVVQTYSRIRLTTFNKYKLAKLQDIFKYLEHFEDKELRILLEKQAEILREERSDSDDDERK